MPSLDQAGLRRWRRLLAGGVSNLAAPSLCAVCRDWGSERLCATCRQIFAAAVPRCSRCAVQVPALVKVCGACVLAPPTYQGVVAAVDYAYPWDDLIAAFKFRDALDLAPALCDLMLASRRSATRLEPAASDDAEPVVQAAGRAGGEIGRSRFASTGRSDAQRHEASRLLVSTPLSAERLRQRGYNQAWELAWRLARATGDPADPGLLLRIKDTAHQLALPAEQRVDNVRGAFAVEPRRAHEIRGRALTLVDDVMTSGATLAEMSRVLLAAGAASVDVWVFARTPLPRGA